MFGDPESHDCSSVEIKDGTDKASPLAETRVKRGSEILDGKRKGLARPIKKTRRKPRWEYVTISDGPDGKDEKASTRASPGRH